MIDLSALEDLIRIGEFAKVTRVISQLNLKKIPRHEAARFANIANRVDQSRLAVRLLYPIIHSEKEVLSPASDAERIEYADALRRTGLIKEAREILFTVDARKFPFAHLQISFCYFNEWHYSQAFPHLRQLIQQTDPENYLHTIAKVNLAAALVHEELYEEALALLLEIQNRTREKGQLLLLGNSLELAAQVYIRQKNGKMRTQPWMPPHKFLASTITSINSSFASGEPLRRVFNPAEFIKIFLNFVSWPAKNRIGNQSVNAICISE